MILPSSAQRLLARHCNPLGEEVVGVEDALGCVLAENLRASDSLPRFDNTAMDGYAVRSADTSNASASRPVRLDIVESVFAGEVSDRRLRNGEAYLIMTGAPIPRGADAVAQKEEVTVEGGCVVLDHAIARGRHIRRRGDEVKKGSLCLRKGTVVNPGTIGCLATLGLDRVRVVRRPAVSVIATGDETIPPGDTLGPGQIYDSNSYMVAAALRQMGMSPVRVRHVGDHPAALNSAVSAALARSDALVVTGGISVGDRDYLRSTLERQKVREVFWRVKQKPGKPLYFGVRGKKVIFGLPGNPASVFTCFYNYVYPALRRLAGYQETGLPRRELPLAEDIFSDDTRWRFLKAKTLNEPKPSVKALRRQASHMISSLVETDCLIVAPPGVGRIPAGTVVTTYMLPRLEDRSG